MNTPWLAHYDATVPHTIGTYPEKTLVDFVAERARKKPDSTALLFKGRRISYGEIERASDAFARGLRGIGVKEGERVALVLPNAPQFIIAELAIWKLGAIIAPQNPIYTERELQESLGATTPETAIVLTPFYERVKRIQPNTSLKRVIATNIKEYLPGVLRVLFTLVKEKKEGHRIELRDGDHWFQSLMKEGAPVQAAAAPDQGAVVLMSGGTTGTPKGVLSDHRSLVMAGTQIEAVLRESLQGRTLRSCCRCRSSTRTDARARRRSRSSAACR